MKTVIAERVIHGGLNRVALKFPYDADLIKIARGFPDAQWSKQMRNWHISDSPDTIILLLKAFHTKAYIDYSAIRPNLAFLVSLRGQRLSTAYRMY